MTRARLGRIGESAAAVIGHACRRVKLVGHAHGMDTCKHNIAGMSSVLRASQDIPYPREHGWLGQTPPARPRARHEPSFGTVAARHAARQPRQPNMADAVRKRQPKAKAIARPSLRHGQSDCSLPAVFPRARSLATQHTPKTFPALSPTPHPHPRSSPIRSSHTPHTSARTDCATLHHLIP
ncbi:hypothetical protein BDU57DRAFT_263536 [Ampelomyces quisqualis]|uniref:Uncharacterized protein n=1 Tax=Ampelomyces quisqualis TaxID=50730 RepID=A0A6A5QM63_AMPQU|nr:hypothetical protein BDU57DRAFT_263536 [Ampelomyces quisqualis]